MNVIQPRPTGRLLKETDCIIILILVWGNRAWFAALNPNVIFIAVAS